MINSRVIGIHASSRDIDIKKVLSHELAPVPTSMFHDSGAMSEVPRTNTRFQAVEAPWFNSLPHELRVLFLRIRYES